MKPRFERWSRPRWPGLLVALAALGHGGAHARTDLFDGTTLRGWTRLGNASWTVQQGEIVARHAASDPDFAHLVHDTVVKDFRLSFQFKSVRGNAGLFFRLGPVPVDPGQVAGAQVVLDPALPNDNAFGIYETGGRLWLRKWDRARHQAQYPHPGTSCMQTRDWPELPLPDSICRKSLLRPGDWNRISVWARGPRLIVKLNMRTIVDMTDPALDRAGRFAFKLHGGSDVEIRFKDVRLEPYPGAGMGVRTRLKKALLYKGEAASPPPLREFMGEIAAENGFALEEGPEAAFTPANLSQYQAVVFLSDYNIHLNASQRAAFEEWYKAGGGAACIHACTRLEITRAWPWYGTVLGTNLASHTGYHERSQAPDPELAARPQWKGFAMEPASWRDEWFHWRQNPRGTPGVTVLLRFSDAGRPGDPAVAGSPTAWIKESQGGRFFAWGALHTMNALEHPFTYDFLLRGLQDAAGIESPPLRAAPALSAPPGMRLRRVGTTLAFQGEKPFRVRIHGTDGRELFRGSRPAGGSLSYQPPSGAGVLIVSMEASGDRLEKRIGAW